MDPYGSVWSLRTPWGLPGASWGPGGSKKGGKGVLTPGGARGASWEACLLALRGLIGCYRLLLALRGILTYTAAWPSYVVSHSAPPSTYSQRMLV